MKLLFVFMLGLFLCGCLVASEEKEKYKSYDKETEGWRKIHEIYMGGDYFAFFFVSEKDEFTCRCFLITSKKGEKKICCKLKYYIACALYPTLTDFDDYYISPMISD